MWWPVPAGQAALVEGDRAAAIAAAVAEAGPDDLVLIAGKGHEDYQILGTERIHFDDREQAEAALRPMLQIMHGFRAFIVTILRQYRASAWDRWSISVLLVNAWVQARRQLGSARSRIQMPSLPSNSTHSAGLRSPGI